MRFIYDLKFDDHISPYMFELHFLPVKFRIIFKVCLIAFKVVKGTAPEYLQENFKLYQRNEDPNLRPSTGRDNLLIKINLEQQKKNTLFTKIINEWNSLPFELRNNVELNGFKRDLKTYLFRIAFKDFLTD